MYPHRDAGHTVVDCTFGMGGHSRALLRAAQVKLLACDCDPDALKVAANFAAKVPCSSPAL
jgi:16S rRNA C1402 N4-methylase RsmH